MISVIISTKNGGAHIDRAIRSVLRQTRRDIEIVIVDDASDDDTPRKIADWVAEDSRIRTFRNEKNIGPGKSRDLAIRLSKGEYIALIDDDDYWLSEHKLARQKRYLDEQPDCILVGAAEIETVTEAGTPIKSYSVPQTDPKIRSQILRKNCFITSTVMFRKTDYLAVGGFSDRYLAEDYELWLKMGLRGLFANISGILSAYTVRSGSASKKRRLELYKAIQEIVRQNQLFYPHRRIALLKASARIAFFHLQSLF